MKSPIKNMLFFVVLFWISSCSKKDGTMPATETNFDAAVLNKDFYIGSANNDGTDITAQFNGYVFKYSKSNSVAGYVIANNNLLNFNGTWTTSADFSTITLAFSNAPDDFNFMNNTWKISAVSNTSFHLTAADDANKILNFIQTQ